MLGRAIFLNGEKTLLPTKHTDRLNSRNGLGCSRIRSIDCYDLPRYKGEEEDLKEL